MTRGLFHCACMLIFLGSVYLTATGGEPRPDAPAQAALSRFLGESGWQILEERSLLGDEALLRVLPAGCGEPVTLLLLPNIHRISALAWAVIDESAPPRVFVHARQEVAFLGAGTLIPRWIHLRTLINLRLAPEDPWASRAVAILGNTGCARVALDWRRL